MAAWFSPSPPLAEQQAIVARIDSLMAMIDELEKQVAERKEQTQMLMQAVLREAFAGGEEAEGDDTCVGATHASPMREMGDKTIRAGVKPDPTKNLPLVAETPSGYKAGGQVVLPAANQPVPGDIPARILSAMQPSREYSRADLLAATGISETDWIWAIRQLKEQGRVVQRGGASLSLHFLDEGGDFDFSPKGTRFFTLISLTKARPFQVYSHRPKGGGQ